MCVLRQNLEANVKIYFCVCLKVKSEFLVHVGPEAEPGDPCGEDEPAGQVRYLPEVLWPQAGHCVCEEHAGGDQTQVEETFEKSRREGETTGPGL